MIEIEFSNQQESHPVDPARLCDAVRAVLEAERIQHASISLAVVDDPTIHDVNRRHLAHDYPTDVLSFVLENDGRLDGEILVSADTAAKQASHYGWDPQDELLLYAIHGALHLAGYDDASPAFCARMREQEARHLAKFGLSPRYDSSAGPA